MASRRFLSTFLVVMAAAGACGPSSSDELPRDRDAAHVPPLGETVPVSLPPSQFALQAELEDTLTSTWAGEDVDLDGNTAIVGTGNERAYVFERIGGVWGSATTLTTNAGQASLGSRVAIEGDLAVLGAQNFGDAVPANFGAVFVFERIGGVWQPPVQITSPVQSSGYNFGSDVAIADGKIYVGASGHDDPANNAGAVYRFGKDASNDWVQEALVVPTTLSQDDRFGAHLDVDGNRLVVGAHFDNTVAPDAGAVYVIDFAGASWSVTAKLTVPNGAVNDNLGRSVAVSGGTVFAGAPGFSSGGAAFVFDEAASWAVTTLLPSAPGMTQFGAAVAVDPPWALVTSLHEAVNQVGDGVVYVFADDGAGWQARQKIHGSPLPNQGILYHEFGRSLALDGSTALVGWPGDPSPGGARGSAWAYAVVGETCSQPAECPGTFCVDGRCCNAVCDGACDRCDVAGFEGVCTPAAGAPGDPSCAPFVCDGTSADCPTSCTQDDQCDDAHHCDGTTCVPKEARGAACSSDSQCLSGHCVDGHCCDGPCDNQCEACDAAGSVGTCTIITGAPHGDRAPCPADSCSDGIEATGSVCAGALTCAPPVETPCAPYACGETACRTSCTLPEHCLAGYVCDYDEAVCVLGAAICEGDVLTHPDGSTTTCAPYRCTSGGICIDSCTSSGECAGGFVCASNGSCIEAPPFEVQSGCALAPPGRGEGWIAVALFGLMARRRRSRVR